MDLYPGFTMLSYCQHRSEALPTPLEWEPIGCLILFSALRTNQWSIASWGPMDSSGLMLESQFSDWFLSQFFFRKRETKVQPKSPIISKNPLLPTMPMLRHNRVKPSKKWCDFKKNIYAMKYTGMIFLKWNHLFSYKCFGQILVIVLFSYKNMQHFQLQKYRSVFPPRFALK